MKRASKAFLKALRKSSSEALHERRKGSRVTEKKRPTCVHCGKAYGQRGSHIEELKWPLGEPMPPYKGNGVVIKEVVLGKTVTRDTLRAVMPLNVNPRIRAAQDAQIALAPEVSHQTGVRYVWDGETFHGGYKPFCTLQCALDYARKAYAETMRQRLR